MNRSESTDSGNDVQTQWKAIAEAAGISPPTEDLAHLHRSYEVGRRYTELIFAVEEARDEEMPLVFSAKISEERPER